MPLNCDSLHLGSDVIRCKTIKETLQKPIIRDTSEKEKCIHPNFEEVYQSEDMVKTCHLPEKVVVNELWSLNCKDGLIANLEREGQKYTESIADLREYGAMDDPLIKEYLKKRSSNIGNVLDLVLQGVEIKIDVYDDGLESLDFTQTIYKKI